jgi:HD-like signal output (HDOD) protein
MAEGNGTTLGKIISRIGDLPAMPAVVAEVMALTANHEVPLSEVSRVIERDPILTVKLLKVGNSPYYGMRQVIGTLKLALVILGVREVRNIVVGVAVLDAVQDKDTEILLHQYGLWPHSLRVAALCKKLGAHAKGAFQGEDFIAGLLHDVGKMVLWRQLEGEYRDLYHAAKRSGKPLHEAEREKFGFDHADVIGALAAVWNLPESLRLAMLYHHDAPGRDLQNAKSPRLAALVRIANAAAHDDWAGLGNDPAKLRSCGEPSWRIIEGAEEGVSPIARYATLAGFVTEIERVPELAWQ